MGSRPEGGRPPGRSGGAGTGPRGAANTGGTGRGTTHSGGGGGKKRTCCPMVEAVKSARRGKFKLARRYAAMSIRLIAAA